MSTPQTSNDNPLSPKGRFGRLSFLAWGMLLNLVVVIISIVFLKIPDINLQSLPSAPLLFILLFLLTTIWNIIFTIRRLHDMNMSGWWALLSTSFIPLYSIIKSPLLVTGLIFSSLIFTVFTLVQTGTKDNNRFGSPRPTKTWETILGTLSYSMIILFVIYYAYIITSIPPKY